MGTIDLIETYSDVHLINELENRGYIVRDIDSNPNYGDDVIYDVEKLYLDYMLMGDKFFDARLHEFFNKHLNKTLRRIK